MSAMKKGLGRGFESLIPTDLIDETFDPTALQDEQMSEFRNLPLKDISADPNQPRRHFDEDALAELAESIKVHGVIQPIIVIRKDGRYQIVAGERRFWAATAAGLKNIPSLIRTLSDQHKLELSLIENIQRRDLSVIETATAYVKLRDQFNLTNEEIGARVNKSPSAVNNTMRLLKLPKEVQEYVATGELSEGQVRPLISLDHDTVMQVIPKIVAEQWSARKVEQYAVNLKKTGPSEQPAVSGAAELDARVAGMTKRLNTKVAIRVNSKGAGSIVIGFKSQAELDRLQSLLGE